MPRSSPAAPPPDGWRRAPEGEQVSPGPTFERVYLALKEQLAGGALAFGDHLEPAAIGEELNSSITPVRDALHRLVGERIVEAPRNDGFRMPAPTEAEIRDLYDWNEALLDLALRRRPPGPSPWPFLEAQARTVHGQAPSRHPAAILFRDIARRSGSAEQEAAIESLSDRLAALRRAELRLFGDPEAELAPLRAALAGKDLPALRRGIAAYHRCRRVCVPQLLLAARMRGPAANNS
jgi:DNA-binding GntR family transcriptional regulator